MDVFGLDLSLVARLGGHALKHQEVAARCDIAEVLVSPRAAAQVSKSAAVQ